MSEDNSAGPIRQQIDLDKLQKYIEDNVPEIKTPLQVKQFGYGQSNPTYLLKSADNRKYVMRKKPPGELVSKTAHQVDREYRIMKALQDTDFPVPRAMCLCDDPSAIGTAFYIMSFVDGRIFADPELPDVGRADRREMWKSAITTLAKLHRIIPSSVGLGNFGRHNHFYDRQVKTFAKLSADQAAKRDVDSGEPVGKIPHFDDMVAFFAQRDTQPEDRGTLVHGDFKIDNLVFHPTHPRVIGVLDWEMATIGHPLSDIANLLGPFAIADNPLARSVGRSNAAFVPGATPGLPSMSECLAWYHGVVDWEFPAKEIKWAESFNLYRGAVICQGIAARYAVRQASSAKARDYGAQMKPFGEMAWESIRSVKKLVEDDEKRKPGRRQNQARL